MNTIVQLIISKINLDAVQEDFNGEQDEHTDKIEFIIKEHEKDKFMNHSITTNTNILESDFNNSFLIITSVLSSTKPNKYL